MPEANAVSVINTVQDSLRLIKKSSGFHTNLGGNVQRGFVAVALQAEEQECPFLVIQPNSEPFTAGPGTLQGKCELSLTLFVVDKADQPDRLMAAMSDVRRALVRLNDGDRKEPIIPNSARFNPAEYNPNPESMYALAALPVSFSFMETYREEPNP